MTNRANFSLDVKEALAKRTGYRCSFPNCGVSTIGPSSESNASISNTGMACHIAAASKGKSARRVVSSMTPEELTNISNGIWMCYRHGKMIDTDEKKYSIEMLRTWRAIAEAKASLSHELGMDRQFTSDEIGISRLPEEIILITQVGDEGKIIHEAFEKCCVEDLWGIDESRSVRDVIIEIIRNAFQHGSASAVSIEFSNLAITVTDNGQNFNSMQLSHHPLGRGGAESLQILSGKHKKKVVFMWRRIENSNSNKFILAQKPNDFNQLQPCVFRVSHRKFDSSKKVEVAAIYNTCSSIYVILPEYMGLSDLYDIGIKLEHNLPEGRRLFFVCYNKSSGFIDLLQRLYPQIEIIAL